MGCCSNCDKGLPCSDDAPKAVSMTGNAGTPTGVGQTRVTTPLQAAMVGKTVMAQLSGAQALKRAVANGKAVRGFGQSAAPSCCGPNTIADANGNCVPACISNGQVPGVPDVAPAVNGQCPQGMTMTPQTLTDRWCQMSTLGKAGVVGVGAVAVGGLGWLLFHKKSPVHKAMKRHVR